MGIARKSARLLAGVVGVLLGRRGGGGALGCFVFRVRLCELSGGLGFDTESAEGTEGHRGAGSGR